MAKTNGGFKLFNSLTKWQIKSIFILFALGIVAAVVFYTQSLVNELIDREQETIRYYTDVYKELGEPDVDIVRQFELIEKITPLISFPVIMTDENDEPNEPLSQWSLNVEIDTSKTLEQQRNRFRILVREFGEAYPPIVIENEEGEVVQKFYYSNSDFVNRLRFFPLIEITVALAFIGIGYIAFSNLRQHEQTKVWVGMAKEAAHQLGTPLSSLMAWMEILRYDKDDPEQVDETITEMEKDVSRLKSIAVRFSKIGSRPEKQIEDISEIIEKVGEYFRKRLPNLGRKVGLSYSAGHGIKAPVNRELFEWVIENLLKNAAEAVEDKNGSVDIKADLIEKKKIVYIEVIDTGKGMSSKQKSLVFNPGFTTKKRGWGIGLTLCKRIIQDYHRGKIYVKESSPGKGTTFAIEVPAALRGKNQ